jgi:hypothetical protein
LGGKESKTSHYIQPGLVSKKTKNKFRVWGQKSNNTYRNNQLGAIMTAYVGLMGNKEFYYLCP